MKNIGYHLKIAVLLFLCLGGSCTHKNVSSERSVYIGRITNHYPEQLTYPQKKDRKCLCQFGYNLNFSTLLFFPLTDFIEPDNFGVHSYGKPDPEEKNGMLYTCKGGFIDFSHLRVGVDWTVYLAFKTIAESENFELPAEAGTLKLNFKNLDDLSLEDIGSLAQKIAFERLLWHEVASWHYHRPNHKVSEQQSAFTPEDIYSNFLGTEIGKNIALRILKNSENASYSEIATEEIEKMVTSLSPVSAKEESKMAYDIVDRHQQLKLPAEQRNKDVWWDSKIVFSDQRYMFKRDMNIGPEIEPWLVPESNHLECSPNSKAEVLTVPQRTNAGESFYDYYEFRIAPDSSLFYGNKSGEQLHEPFQSFSTRDFDKIINHISRDMEKKLFAGFDQRNCFDPVPYFTKKRKAIFK